MAKPIVDGLERELAGRIEVIRVDVMSVLGRQLAARYDISGVPTTLVLDGVGEVVFRHGGPPSRTRVLEAVQAVSR